MMESTKGFTLAEVLVAVMILSVGLLAIAASSGSVYRMLGYGKLSTEVSHIVSTRMEILRRIANSTVPKCASSSLASGLDTVADNVVEQWTVSGVGGQRDVVIVVTTPAGHGPANDTIFGSINCR